MNDLDLMLAAASDAAKLISEVYAAPFEVEYKAPRDPVTLADRRANDSICKALRAAWPGVPVVAEESDPESFAGFRKAARAFFVDPLDGTREFIAKNGEFVVMIGLLDGDRPSLGVVLAPATGLAWAADAKKTAEQIAPDGTRTELCVSATANLADARVVSTRSHRSPALEEALAALGVRQLDALGSAGLKCVEVAAGRAEAYVAPGRAGSRWDICACQALVEAAGGVVTDAFGDAIDYRAQSLVNDRGVVASNGKVHAEILRRLAEVRARRTMHS